MEYVPANAQLKASIFMYELLIIPVNEMTSQRNNDSNNAYDKGDNSVYPSSLLCCRVTVILKNQRS